MGNVLNVRNCWQMQSYACRNKKPSVLILYERHQAGAHRWGKGYQGTHPQLTKANKTVLRSCKKGKWGPDSKFQFFPLQRSKKSPWNCNPWIESQVATRQRNTWKGSDESSRDDFWSRGQNISGEAEWAWSDEPYLMIMTFNWFIQFVEG